MKPILLLLSISLILSSCAATITNSPEGTSNKPVNVGVVSEYDKAWDKVFSYIYEHGYQVQSSSKVDGTMMIKTINSAITCKDKKGIIRDTLALAITDTRKRMNNNKMVYAQTGNLTWSIYIKKEDNSASVFIKLESMGDITSFYEGSKLFHKKISNSKMISTGIFEKQMQATIN